MDSKIRKLLVKLYAHASELGAYLEYTPMKDVTPELMLYLAESNEEIKILLQEAINSEDFIEDEDDYDFFPMPPKEMMS